jgi:glycosyltransferase involved in cell wall biosynthesis
MRILLIHNFYQQFGGADWIALKEKEYLERTDEVFFYTKHNRDIETPTLGKKLGFAANTLYNRRAGEEVREIVQQFAPDFVYLHNFYPLMSPAIVHALHAMRVPILQKFSDFRPICPNGLFFANGDICERCIHGNFFHTISQRCYKESYQLSSLYAASVALFRMMGAIRKVDAYLFLTPFAQKKFVEAGVPAERTYITPNYIDASKVKPSTEVGSYAAFLGRIAQEKGLWTLLRAFEMLPHRRLKIAGRGPVEAELRQYVQQRGIQNIEFVGFKSDESKQEFLRNSAFLILPSECYEQMPISILEAFASGKPVVAADLGSIPYIVEDGKNGLLYKVGNATDLANKADFLLANPEMILRMGHYARHLIDTRYSPSHGRQLLVDIFQRVVGQRREPGYTSEIPAEQVTDAPRA